jgi:NhaP-type Na+/H+ or K+/H+ antiporter
MFPETATPATTFVIAVLIATASQMLANRFRFPSIVLWLLAGMALGPFGVNVIHVESLEHALHPLIELGLAIILFEGGLSLNLKELRANGWVVGRMLVFGPLLTIIIGASTAHMVTGIDWPLALLFGALVSVSGPTVILPIIRETRLGRNISHILTAEAMLIDVVGAILAIVFLQVALTPEISHSLIAQDILIKIAVGVVIGLVGGRLLAMLLSSNWCKDADIRTILTLSSVWGVFLLSDSISSQAGLLAVLMMGAILQRMEVYDIQRLKHFKGSLSMLLISVLFVLLAANMNLPVLINYLYPGLLIFAILACIARPLAVLFSTVGSRLSFNESVYLAGMAPRGVVAAGIASLFALILKENGNAQSEMLVALVYIIIIISVLSYSLFAKPLKKMLAIEGGDERSVLIVGGEQIGAELGRALSEDREVRFLDSNEEVVTSLKHSGYNAIYGNVMDPLYWEIIHAEDMGAVIILTGSSGHNLLLARLASENFHTPEIYVALKEDRDEKYSNLIHRLQARRLFGKPYSFTYWNDQAYRKRLVYESRFIEPDSPLIDEKMGNVSITHGMQPIAIVRDGKTLIPHDDLKFAAGDEIKLLMRPERTQEGQALILPPVSKPKTAT